MNLLNLLLLKPSAPAARERLKPLLTHERTFVSGKHDLVNLLREELLAVSAKHTGAERESIHIK
jgi:cell division topological specificity factor